MRPEKLPFIVGLGGTTRPGSSTELALRFTLKVAGELGAETKMFGGHDLLMPIYDPYMAERTENAAGLIEALRRCDGVVIASPGYHGSVSGLVKNALDYTEDMRNDLEPYFEGRSVGCIACALGSQATGTTLVTLRSIVHALRGWPTPFGVGINTTRTGILTNLQRMGAEIEHESEREEGGEPIADLHIRATPLRATEVGGAEVPLAIDELPLVALAACFAEGRTTIRDAEELRRKESDRVETVSAALNALGGAVEPTADGLFVTVICVVSVCCLYSTGVDGFG